MREGGFVETGDVGKTANTSLTRCGTAGSDVSLEFGDGDVAAPAVLVDRKLAGANALVERGAAQP